MIYVLNTAVGFRVFSKRFRHFAVTHGEPASKGGVLPRSLRGQGMDVPEGLTRSLIAAVKA